MLRIQKGYTVAVFYAERHTFTYGDPGIKLEDPQILKVCKTNSYTQHSFTYTNVIENYKDLPDIVEQVAGTKRPDSTVLRCHERDQNMPWVQQEDYVIKSVWKMLFILVL
jgi:hypothetical protein